MIRECLGTCIRWTLTERSLGVLLLLPALLYVLRVLLVLWLLLPLRRLWRLRRLGVSWLLLRRRGVLPLLLKLLHLFLHFCLHLRWKLTQLLQQRRQLADCWRLAGCVSASGGTADSAGGVWGGHPPPRVGDSTWRSRLVAHRWGAGMGGRGYTREPVLTTTRPRYTTRRKVFGRATPPSPDTNPDTRTVKIEALH